MTLAQLRHLLSLAETGSFSKSSKALFLTQPALSRSIQALEEELGVQLCERHSGGMRATEAGRLLIQHYHAQRLSEEAVLSQLLAIQEMAQGEVRIAGQTMSRMSAQDGADVGRHDAVD